MMVSVGPGRGLEPALATLIAAVPLTPSLVAVMVADPAPRPRTSPLALKLATAGVPLVQVTVRPLSTFPALSFRVALSWRPTPRSRVAVAGLVTPHAPQAPRAVGGGAARGWLLPPPRAGGRTQTPAPPPNKPPAPALPTGRS